VRRLPLAIVVTLGCGVFALAAALAGSAVARTAFCSDSRLSDGILASHESASGVPCSVVHQLISQGWVWRWGKVVWGGKPPATPGRRSPQWWSCREVLDDFPNANPPKPGSRTVEGSVTQCRSGHKTFRFMEGRVHRLIRGQIPDRLPTRQRVVALTFDAGANDAGAPKILSALASARATGTFFMTGRWAQLYPGYARRIAARYPIANHTFNHRDLTTLSLPEVKSEVLGAASAIDKATGRPPIRLFRFPYGSNNGATLQVVNNLGYTAVGWTVDTLGWEGTAMGQSVGSVTSRALAHLEPGEVILMHVGSAPDNSTLDADALPGIIRAIRAHGYHFVTLNQYW
jgi:peptidoglycan/xylan/chitin deacetylase (PgdA/CDA1 family)